MGTEYILIILAFLIVPFNKDSQIISVSLIGVSLLIMLYKYNRTLRENEKITESVYMEKLEYKVKYFIKDLAVGLSILGAYTLLLNLGLFKYKPWIAKPLFFLIDAIYSVAIVIFVINISKKRNIKNIIPNINLRIIIKELPYAVFSLITIEILVFIVINILSLIFSKKPTKSSIIDAFSYNIGSFYVLLLLVWTFTITPIVEEMFYRGFIYNTVKVKMSFYFAVLVSGILFAVCHEGNIMNMVSYFIMGVGLALVYEKRQTLVTPILVHCIKNSIPAVIFLILSLQNFDLPAKSWEEARKNPNWFKAKPPETIAQQDSGLKQYNYIIKTYGEKGKKLWIDTINGLNAVCVWFKEDKEACAKAKVKIADIYYRYLIDIRRAALIADEVLQEYPEYKKECADALVTKGWSYYYLREFKKSRKAFKSVMDEYSEYGESVRSAEKGLYWLKNKDKVIDWEKLKRQKTG